MSILKDYSVLLTGANGFLGSVVLGYLRKVGARVVGTARHGNASSFKDILFVDLVDPSTYKPLEAAGSFDAVVHFAAVLPGRNSEMNILLNNQRMTYNILDWAVKHQVKKVILASSCNIYGYSTKPCTELTLPSPPNLYAIGKLACEHITKLFSMEHQIENCILRISAPYGPHMKAQTVVKLFIQQAARKEPITLFGSGDRMQDFIYEEDVARAVELVLLHDAMDTYNISGNRPISMFELAKTVIELFGIPPDTAIRFSGSDPQESYRGQFLTDLASRDINFLPEVTLEEGLKQTAVAWGLL